MAEKAVKAVKAIIFDLDNTLIETSRAGDAALHQVMITSPCLRHSSVPVNVFFMHFSFLCDPQTVTDFPVTCRVFHCTLSAFISVRK